MAQEQENRFLMLGIFIFSVAVMLPIAVFAQQFDGAKPPRGAMGMGGGDFTISDAAINACSDSSENSTCSFTDTDKNGTSNTVGGTCMKNPKDQSKLACMPKPKDRNENNGREPKDMGNFIVSDKSVSACSDSSENSTCSFTDTDKNGTSNTVGGTCIKNPKNTEELFCAPSVKNKKDTSEKATAMKKREAAEISNIESRVEKIVAFLESEDIDTTEITENLETFKTKAETLLSAFDKYISALEADENDASDSTKLAVSNARAKLKSAKDALRDFYSSTLRTSINSAIEKINE